MYFEFSYRKDNAKLSISTLVSSKNAIFKCEVNDKVQESEIIIIKVENPNYAKNIVFVENPTWFPLQNPLLFEYCRNYVENGLFAKVINKEVKKSRKTTKKSAK